MKSTIQLNIGLDTNDNGTLVPRQIIPSLNLLGDIIALRVVTSPTNEKTVAAEIETSVDAEYLRACIHQFAVNLRQDCIACVIDGQGELIGPKSYEWGEFNPDKFVCFLEDGQTCTLTESNKPRFVELPPGPNLIEALRRIR